MAKVPSPLSGIRKWIDREEWWQPFNDLLREHLKAPCKAVGIGIDDLPEVIGADATSNLFGCVFEDMLATEFADGGNVVDDYLKRRGWKEPVPNKRYMMALRSSVMSLYEVSGIVRGESFVARDLLRGGEPIQVSEKRATRRMRPWDLLAARIVKVGSRNEVTGGALPLARTAGAILEEGFAAFREKMRPEIQGARKPGSAELNPYALDTEVLRRVAFLFSQVWLIDILRRMLDSRPPAMVNSDGEALEATTVTYPLKPDADRKALGDALAAVPQLRPAPDARWDWIGPRGTLSTSNEFDRADLSGNPLPEGSVSWGHVALEGDSLTLDTDSRQRAEKGSALLDPVIGAFVEQPAVTTVTADGIMAPRPEGEEAPSLPVSADEAQADLHRAMERHYRGLLDRPVPALGNMTPHEAAKSTDGRKRLAGWLKGIENAKAQSEPGSPIATYDVTCLWEELGISDLRR